MITKAQARGDSQGLSASDYRKHARNGAYELANLLGVRPDAITEERAWQSVQGAWGGVTITLPGQYIVTPVTGYAVSVSGSANFGHTIVRRIGVDRDTFVSAYREALRKFQGAPCIGVFRDDDTGLIEFDAVVIVADRDLARDIATHCGSLGGAYDFATGNGVWPYHHDPDIN